jgi:hypothetical protein
MPLLTVMLMGYEMKKGLVDLTLVEIDGTTKTRTFYPGKLTAREFEAFKNKRVQIQYETGSKEYPQLNGIALY